MSRWVHVSTDHPYSTCMPDFFSIDTTTVTVTDRWQCSECGAERNTYRGEFSSCKEPRELCPVCSVMES